VRLPPPFYERGPHIAADLPAASVVFTTRRGGGSAGPYASLNLGRLTGDRPESVAANRALVEGELGVRLVHGRQVHGAKVRLLDTAPDVSGVPEEVDGQATALPGLGLMVLVADCLPIALAGRGAVAMLHAGWRGLAEGIVGEGVRAMRELALDGELTAVIGPGAGPCCYEVGEDVHAAFGHGATHARRGRNLDLKAIARAKLEQAGVPEVHDVGLCTICAEPSLLFSHRRDRGVTGRQAGIVWLS
jgi:YfiH family protein